MDERVIQARVGIVVISALLLTGILIVVFGDVPTPFQRGKTLVVTFPSAPGVAEGTPVRKSGVLVGRVQQVALDRESSDVKVTLRLNNRAELRQNEQCRINSGSLLGDAVLEFIPIEDAPKDSPPIADGAQLQGTVTTSPMEMLNNVEGDLRETLSSLSNASTQVAQLADNVNEIVEGQDEKRLERILTQTETALEQFNTAMAKINRLLGDEAMEDDLKQFIEDLPELTETTRQAMSRFKDVADRADRNLANLEGLTEPLDEYGRDIVERLDLGIQNFDKAMGEFATFSKRINSEEGSLGRLINDPDLYQNLNAAAANIQRLTVEIRPIMNDVRVFTDKIARDPGRLGVSGALQQRSRNKYPNFQFNQQPPIEWHDDLRPPLDWHDFPSHYEQQYPGPPAAQR